MCLPAIPLAISAYASIAASVASVAAATMSARAQSDALSKQAQQRSTEITPQASQQMGIRAQQARIDQGRAEVAGGESGLSGNSFEAQLSDVAQKASIDEGTITQNARYGQLSNTNDFNAAASRINRPNPLSSGLQIGGSVLDQTAQFSKQNGGANLWSSSALQI
jgi:hypothetical protein